MSALVDGASGLTMGHLLVAAGIWLYWRDRIRAALFLVNLGLVVFVLYLFRFSNQINIHSPSLMLLIALQIVLMGLVIPFIRTGALLSASWSRIMALILIVNTVGVNLISFFYTKNLVFTLQAIVWSVLFITALLSRQAIFALIAFCWTYLHIYLIASAVYITGLQDRQVGELLYTIFLFSIPTVFYTLDCLQRQSFKWKSNFWVSLAFFWIALSGLYWLY